MIQVGDIVRLKNGYIRVNDNLCIHLFCRRNKRKYKNHRGLNPLRQVAEVQWDKFDWRNKTNNRVVKLDNGASISTEYLAFVFRPKATP